MTCSIKKAFGRWDRICGAGGIFISSKLSDETRGK
jgi:hypothetical protein